MNKISRRKYLAMAAPFLLAAIGFPLLTNSLMRPRISKSKYNRTKKRNNSIKENPVANSLNPGFYINKQNVLHYVTSDGICRSLKNVARGDGPKFLSNLRPVNLQSDKLNPKQIHVPFAISVFSRELTRLESSKDIFAAWLTVKFGLEIFLIRKYDGAAIFRRISEEFLKTNAKSLNPEQIKSIEDLINKFRLNQ